MDRAKLYERINLRVELMMEAGQLAEAQSLYPLKALKSLQTVGYQELFDYLDGEISLPRAVELIQQNSRRYAKRQMTWFRKQAQNATWHNIDPNAPNEALAIIKAQMTH